MAEIKAATSEKVFSLTAFKGLNQNPDGDTKLKMGEAAEMTNFRITRDGNLQRRPGTKTIIDLEIGAPIKGLWNGMVNGHEYVLGACNNKLYKFWTDDGSAFDAVELGAVSTQNDVHIFGFSNIVYILDGNKYRQWDGTTLKEVEGYAPLVMISIPPVNGAGESATLENVNRLSPKRRVWISPDGTNATFQLPEKDLASIDYVKDLLTGEEIDSEDYTADAVNGTVTFDTAPAQAVNSYEIGWTKNNNLRSQVEHMRYAEMFAGQQDTRIFLYGDGTNKTIYSGIDYDGIPRADYFPDLYEALVGDENTPITGMIRHYASLVCFKSDSTWGITATDLSLADGLNIPAFFVTPVNRAIGNAAPGQVRLVLNSPYTLFGSDLYEWKNSSYYTSNLTRDERQAKRISDRVFETLKGFTTENCYCYDDNNAQEYYICYNGKALVYNYAVDAWSKYSGFPVSSMVNLHGDLYIGGDDGKLRHFSYDHLNDDGTPIYAYWESGSIDFGKLHMRKYSAMTWVSIKPENNSGVTVAVRTERDNVAKQKGIGVGPFEFDFADVDFSAWQFKDIQNPQVYRCKLKAKKFVYYKLIFQSNSAEITSTVLGADIRVRYTGYAK